MSKPQDLIQPRIASYLQGAWYARWGVIIIVGISFWFMPPINRNVVGALLVAAAAFNFLLLAGQHYRWAFASNRSLILLLDGAMALVLVSCSGGTTSPYLLILAFMIISGAYWYGIWISVCIGLAQTLVLSAQYWEQNERPLFPQGLVVRMLILMTVGIYVALLTKSDRVERQTLLTLGTETEKERQQLLALINNMRDAVLVIDNSDSIVIYNQAAANLAGRQPSLQGQSIGKTLRFEDANRQPAEFKVKRTDSAFERKDLRLRAADNSLINVAVSVAPYIVDRQNRGHVLIIRDTSQEKTIDKEREEFIAVASHELRTPLTIAQSALSMLLMPPYLSEDKEAVQMLNGALRSLKQLSHIISDLTNMSQVEHKKLEVALEPLNPVALLREFQADYSDQAKAKGLDLRLTIDPDLSSSTILTSRYLVREILTIFLTNALKFTDEGAVTLEVMNPENHSAGVTFSISDTGVGISQSDQKKIFEKFFQSENYATRIHGGTGLGLYIAKQLAARITARIWFETELDKGSTFYLWVPPYSKNEQDRRQVAVAETQDFFSHV
jgi:PAS domain S-box-containing protein